MASGLKWTMMPLFFIAFMCPLLKFEERDKVNDIKLTMPSQIIKLSEHSDHQIYGNYI